MAIKVMTHLAKQSGCFPSALWLCDIQFDKDFRIEGGFGDVHKGRWRTQVVALKFHRYFTHNHEKNAEAKKVNFMSTQLSFDIA